MRNEEYLSRMRGFLRGTNGKLMTVEFVKKNGEHRVMTCMTGVKKHLVDPDSPPDPDMIEQDIRCKLLRVFDVNAPAPKNSDREKGDYRSIKLEKILKIRSGGEEYVLEE